MEMINLNGVFFSKNEVVLSSQNRAFKYGDGLFETLKFENSTIYFLEDHYFRLMASMRMLRMEIPMYFTLDFFEQEILKSVIENSLESARIRFVVVRKEGGLYTPITNKIDYLIEVEPLNKKINSDYSIDVFSDFYVYSGIISTLKTTNKLVNVLGGIYASENKLDNCVLVNEKKMVVEALNGNIFMVIGNTIKTPPLTEGCIKGIARKKIIEMLSKSTTYKLEEVEISTFELLKADEIFITNVIKGIQPVSNFKKGTFTKVISEELITEFSQLV